MSNLLERLSSRTRLILGALIALGVYYIMDKYESGGFVSFLCGFSSAFSFVMLVSYKSNTLFKRR
ncbi:hypothetical protein [Winogradskyella psychrotolerans]|uniref:hypothetical protein n=1 Tax=Winogradskyella psychrotolerans TaxID=1344585 RepID=UPI001C06BBD9|nr:hypothetical protein [Winogradskyella psychrotolerans]MBU2929987.1 hypothetical protein [Winogradskyella psychrotolerans]